MSMKILTLLEANKVGWATTVDDTLHIRENHWLTFQVMLIHNQIVHDIYACLTYCSSTKLAMSQSTPAFCYGEDIY